MKTVRPTPQSTVAGGSLSMHATLLFLVAMSGLRMFYASCTQFDARMNGEGKAFVQ